MKRRLGTQGVRFFSNGRFLGNGKGVDVVPGTLYSRKARVRSFFSARFFREREGGRLPILNKGGVFGKVLVAREREKEPSENIMVDFSTLHRCRGKSSRKNDRELNALAPHGTRSMRSSQLTPSLESSVVRRARCTFPNVTSSDARVL